jgi:hypothetical protein
MITTTVPEQVPASDIADARLVRIGADDRGQRTRDRGPGLDDAIIVIHVMPASLRR